MKTADNVQPEQMQQLMTTKKKTGHFRCYQEKTYNGLTMAGLEEMILQLNQ